MTAAREDPANLGIDPALRVSYNNFHQLARYSEEALPSAANDVGYGICVMQQIQSGAIALATPYLEEIQNMPDAHVAQNLATVNCVAHADAV